MVLCLCFYCVACKTWQILYNKYIMQFILLFSVHKCWKTRWLYPMYMLWKVFAE